MGHESACVGDGGKDKEHFVLGDTSEGMVGVGRWGRVDWVEGRENGLFVVLDIGERDGIKEV